MSSQTQTPEQLCEAEKHRALKLEKRNDRLEAELEQARTKLDDFEATSELRCRAKDEQLRAKDATIQELQAAFDNADRPSTSGDVKYASLEAKIKLLETQVQDAEQNGALALKGRWSEIRPFLEEQFKRDLFVTKAALYGCQQDLEQSQAELKVVRAQKARLQHEFNNMLLENEDHASHLRARAERIGSASDHALLIHQALEHDLSEVEGSNTKFFKSNARGRRQYDELVTEPMPVTQGQALQPSRTQTSVPQPKSLPTSHGKGQAKKEGTEKPRATDDRGFTVAGKGRSAHAKQGPKQESLAEQAASSNRYAPLTEHEKKTPKSLSHAKDSTDSRQPSPNSKSVNQAAEKRGWKPDSASQPSSDRKDQKAVSKTALPVNTRALTQPKSSFNPAAASFAPSSSVSMAQVAANPPKQKASVSGNFMKKFMFEEPGDKPIPKSKIPDTKRFAAAVGIVVEPATRKPKPEPTASDIAKDTLENDTPAGAEGPKSPMTTAYPPKRSPNWEALERQLGKMPDKWSDTLENDEGEQNMSSANSRPKGAVPPLSVQLVTPNLGVQELPPDQGAQSAEKASEYIGPSTTPGEGVPLVPKDSPALARSDPHRSAAQVTTVTGNQSEGVRLIDLVISGTLPSTPAATGPSPPSGNVIPGKKKFEDDVMYQPHPSGSGRPKGKKSKKFHTQSELLNQAKAGTDNS